jgi:uncharacterized membrane protein YraQ (UPF0718 family)
MIFAIYGLLAVCLGISIAVSREKTMKAFKIAFKAFSKTAPSLLGMLVMVGLILGILTPETIERLVGAEAGWIATATAAILGSITLIPSLIAFPLAGSLLRSGATVMTISVFMTTLVMVGFVTAPVEIKALGKRFTLLRNGLGIVFAVLIAAAMEVIL